MLERALKVTLLHRDTRGSTLTPNGQIVVGWAAALLREAEGFSNSVSALARQRDSPMHAAVSMTVAEHYAPRWLAELQDQDPGAVVSLTIANSAEVMHMVKEGRADVGVIESPCLETGLQYAPIGRDALALAVAPTHPWARVTGVTAADLASVELLVRESGSGIRDTLAAALADQGLGLRPGMQLASNTALKSAAVAGMGPVVLSVLTLAHEFDSGALIEVPITDLNLSRRLTVVWAQGSIVSTQAACLFVRAADKVHPGPRG